MSFCLTNFLSHGSLPQNFFKTIKLEICIYNKRIVCKSTECQTVEQPSRQLPGRPSGTTLRHPLVPSHPRWCNVIGQTQPLPHDCPIEGGPDHRLESCHEWVGPSSGRESWVPGASGQRERREVDAGSLERKAYCSRNSMHQASSVFIIII